MQIKVLGASGSEVPGHNPPAFLVDDFLLLDAGTVSLSLDWEAQCKITHIFLSHAHLDHIKGIPFLVDNFVLSHRPCQLVVLSGREVIDDLKGNVFNNRIWPDFSLIPQADHPVMRYETISSRSVYRIGDHTVYPVRVDHSVPSFGYIIEDGNGVALAYTGDTGPTEQIWKRMKHHRVRALIIEVSFPDEMFHLARLSGHLTPALLRKEIEKMPYLPETLYITHLKPYFKEAIERELADLDEVSIVILEDGMVLSL